MTAVFAGQWGPEAVLDRTGNVLPGASVTLYDADGTTPSTLWTGRTKATTTPNPFPPDANGNISFFAEPGAHVLAVTVGAAVTRLPITVPVDPHEDQPLDADLAAIAALATTPYGRGFLVLTDASAARGALGLGTAATADATAFDASGAAATVGAAAVHVAGVETVTGAKDFTGGLTKSGVAVETTAGAQTKADVAQAAATTPDATTATKGRVQLAGDLAGTAASPTVPGLAAKAADSAVVHNTGAENVAGVKTFSSAPVVPAGAFPEAAVANLTADLAAKAPVASPTFTGTVTVPAPAGPTDAATKAYVDAVAQGLSVLASVVVLATANVALTGLQTIDGVTLADGNRVLLTGQTTGSQNGPWVAHPGAWTRPADFPSGGTEQGDFVFVESGTANAGSGWVMTGATVVTVDTTGHTWTQFSGAGEILAGTAITKTGNTIAVSLGTGSTQAAAGNDSRLVGAAQKASNLSDLASAATARANLGAAPALTRTAVKTAAYTAQANEQVPVDTTGGAVPIALVGAPADKSRIAVKLILQDAPGVNWVTITCGGSDVFNRGGGPTTATLKLPSQGLLLDYDAGTGIWTAVADDLPLAALDIRFAPATGSTTYAPATGGVNIVGFMGDSITALNGTGDNVATFENLIDNYSGLIPLLSMGRLIYGGSFATPGLTLAQIQSTVLPRLLAATVRPGTCVILGGTNDVGLGAGFSVSSSMTTLAQICATLLSNKITPVLCTIPPRGDSTIPKQNVQVLNAAISGYARLHGYRLIDFYTVLVDPTTGDYLTALRNSDHIHPSPAGMLAMAQAAISSGFHLTFPTFIPSMTRSNVDTANLLPAYQGIFDTDSNSDGVADGLASFGGTKTSSRVAATLAGDTCVSYWQKISRTSAETGGKSYLQFVPTLGSFAVTGDRISLTCRLKVASATGAYSATTGVSVGMTLKDSGNTDRDGITFQTSQDLDGVVYLERIIRSDTTKIGITFGVDTPSTGTVDARIGQVTVRNLTALGIAS